jgi:microcystin-dependent protein
MLPYTYIPLGWAACDGQLLPVNQNSALFSIIGTTFGGNGLTTMGLPNLQGRSPLGAGNAPGLSSYLFGRMGGVEAVALHESEMPAHNHQAFGNKFAGTTQEPGPTVLYGGEADAKYQTYKQDPTTKTVMASTALSTEGGGLGHENRQPYLAVQFCICIDGAYPQRS